MYVVTNASVSLLECFCKSSNVLLSAFTNASVSLLKCFKALQKFCKPVQMHVQAFTNASVRLHCLFPDLAPFEGPFSPSSGGVHCLESICKLLEKWCR